MTVWRPEWTRDAPDRPDVFVDDSLNYNGDGSTDLLLAGNMNETRVRFAKYDANYGVLLRGNGKGGFEYVPQRTSGFKVRGDVRSIITVQDRLLFGVNRDSVTAYSPSGARSLARIAPSSRTAGVVGDR